MDGETGRMDPEGVLIQKLEMRYVVVVDLVYRQVWQDRRMKSSEYVRRKHFCLLPNTNHMPLLEVKLPSVGRSVGWYAIISKKARAGNFSFMLLLEHSLFSETVRILYRLRMKISTQG